MDLFLIIFAGFLMFLGLIGSFLPVLPGPLTGWIGLLILFITPSINVGKSTIIITLVVSIIIWVLDYFIPAIGAKHFGGTKAGMIGTTIGLILGLLSPIPGGIILGLFIGAFIGELLNNANTKTALKAALGSLIGFLTSSLIKLAVSLVYVAIFINIIWSQKISMF
jgi:uncharacterized protein YqgC (DUF456 family)